MRFGCVQIGVNKLLHHHNSVLSFVVVSVIVFAAINKTQIVTNSNMPTAYCAVSGEVSLCVLVGKGSGFVYSQC